MSSDHIMRWRLVIKEYEPDIKYISGPDNFIADALSQLPIVDENIDDKKTYARQFKMVKKRKTSTKFAL